MIKINQIKSLFDEVLWLNLTLMTMAHIAGVYGAVLAINEAKLITIIYTNLIGVSSMIIGIQCGNHRLWCHRSYKAKLPLQLIMAFFQTMAFQTSIYSWCRDHRVHHKYTDTNGDPHNSNRGFFFSHIGWLVCRRNPDVLKNGRSININDLRKNRVVQLQRHYYVPLVFLIWGVIPAMVPYCIWRESLTCSVFTCVFFRYVLILNMTLLVNSVSHAWGVKPYDKGIKPVECHVRHLLLGEGFHNYHHTFPWDYSTSEYDSLSVFNPASAAIDVFAKIGWAYDLKRVPERTIKMKQVKSGDVNFKTSSAISEMLFGLLTLFSSSILIIAFKYLKFYV